MCPISRNISRKLPIIIIEAMKIFAPCYVVGTAGFFAGMGALYCPTPACAIAGAIFGTVVSGFGLAMMVGGEREATRPVLRAVYKDLVKYRYRVVRTFGSSHNTLVVSALQRSDGRAVVLKLPNPSMKAIAVSGKSHELRAEFEITKAISSRHVVAALDSFSGEAENGSFFIAVFENVSGPSLREEMNRGLLSLGQVKRHFPALARGLRDVHRAGYVHADIKPENVILNPERGAVLIDFQSAMEMRGYGAPLHEWCDLLYEAMIGSQGRFGPEDTIQRILEGRGAWKSSDMEDARALQAIVDRALGRHGATPYTDLDEFIADLERFAGIMQ